MKLFLRLLYPIVCVGIGWIIGSKHQAPPIVLEKTDQLLLATEGAIKEALSERESVIATLKKTATTLAPSPGNKQDTRKTKPGDSTADIPEDGEDDIIVLAAAPSGVAPAPVANDEIILGENGVAPFLKLCKLSKISNALPVNSRGEVKNYKPFVDVNGVTMAMMPVRTACVSSGFGPRNGKLHKGIDYFSKEGGMIFAAGDGQIVEAEYRNDYGYTVLINHGNDYFTRYAHLAGFSKGVVVGAAVPRGFGLGEMGRSSGYNIPIHLHFELLKGDYNNPKKSFGLKPVSIYSFK